MGRNRQEWIMSTQRREERFSLATKVSRLGARLRSWCARWKNRAVGVGDESQSCSARDPEANAKRPTAQPESPALVAKKSLQMDLRRQETAKHVQLSLSIRLGSPHMNLAALHGPSYERSQGSPPVHLPACGSRFHRSRPWAPAALRRWTERYDGKRDLHFKHAA
jgi:hypothetical protein